jgi:serine/threonine protein kinase
MNESLPQENTADLSALQRIDELCDQFEEAWRKGVHPRIEDYLAKAPEAERAALLGQLLKVELELRAKAGEAVTVEEYQQRFPLFVDLVTDLVKKAAYRCSSSTVIDSVGSPGKPTPTSVHSEEETGPFIPRSKDDPDPFKAKGAVGNETGVPRVLGDYEILERLGKGGMGIVHRARQLSANRIVALKVIRPERLEDLPPEQCREWLRRFRAEGQAAARVDHENVVTVYEVGEVNGQLFYSMRYVEGRSLADLLRENGPMPDRKAAAYLEPVARALHHVHGHGILHRDLKPGNILVDGTGRPLVADFGLAKWLKDEPDTVQTHGPLGTPDYMAPEQASDGALAVAASDVYSLGATLYALLTGRPPFQAPDPIETLRQVMDAEAVPPRRLNPAIARDLETICLKCLNKQPHKRYGSADELARDLKRFLDGKPITSRPVGWAERTLKWAKPETCDCLPASRDCALDRRWLRGHLFAVPERRSREERGRSTEEACGRAPRFHAPHADELAIDADCGLIRTLPR